ncbi:MAG: rhodanese-like domain-containing protein [Candidatus Marinimicrobia bacterium]|nr:rhodanese-like domain-containing protein [Candidatus Neomarinimicrobiota bacterium]
MIHRLIAYSMILLGIGSTIYMGIEGIYGDRYEVPALSFDSFEKQMEASVSYIIIDVRTEKEIESNPAPWETTMNIPLLSLEERCVELNQYKGQPIMVVCPTGNRSRQGARILRLAGFEAYYLEYGIEKGTNLHG